MTAKQIEALIQIAANAIEVSLTILSSSSDTEHRIEAVDTIAEAVSNLLDILPIANTGDFNPPRHTRTKSRRQFLV